MIDVSIISSETNNQCHVSVTENGEIRRDLLCADEGGSTTYFWAEREAKDIWSRLSNRGIQLTGHNWD